MSKIKHPGEKKRQALAHDRRNVYSENSKASRKGIALAKARSHRKDRRSTTEALSELPAGTDADAATAADNEVRSRVRRAKAKAFRKVPDQPLAAHLVRQAKRRQKRSSRRKGSRGPA